MEGQRKQGERGFNFASLNLNAEPAPKEEPKKKGDYSFATSLMQKIAEGSPKPKIGKGAELKWDGTKFVLHVDGKPAPIKEPIKEKTPPTPQAPSGRDVEPPTKNPNNIPQKGTIMGRSSLLMKDAQPYVGNDVQIKNPFLSNALPGTNDDGFAGGDSPVIESIDGKAIKGGPISINEYNTRYSNDNKPIEVQSTEGSANLVQSGGVKVNDIEDSSTWTEDYARRRAFLDAEDSMAGLKAVQAQKGIVYAGDKYYMNTGKTGEDGNPVLEAIEGPNAKQDVRGYMRGAQGAEDLKAKYIDKIKASKPVPIENVGDTPIASSPVESPINMNESPDDFVAPLTDMPAYTDKDRTGRFNIFR